jgi:5-hydroxyisourate hydrolase-like protein (transthyretin family)
MAMRRVSKVLSFLCWWWLLSLAAKLGSTEAFQGPRSPWRRPSTLRVHAAPLHKVLFTTLDSTMSMGTPSSSTILLAEETWRQYVPLAVSLIVILDILLGSPMANSVLGLVRTKEDATEETTTKKMIKTKGERIDSSQVAEAALERARNALEYQTVRDQYKTDAQRMEDMRKKMDDQLRAMDYKE